MLKHLESTRIPLSVSNIEASIHQKMSSIQCREPLSLHSDNITKSNIPCLSVRLKKKKKFCASKLPPAFVFLCAFDFAKFRLSFFFSWNYYFFFIFTMKNEERLLFWKKISTWELKKRVKSRLISENTEVETFQSFLVSDVRGSKGQLNFLKNKIKNKKRMPRRFEKFSQALRQSIFFSLTVHNLVPPLTYIKYLKSWGTFGQVCLGTGGKHSVRHILVLLCFPAAEYC